MKISKKYLQKIIKEEVSRYDMPRAVRGKISSKAHKLNAAFRSVFNDFSGHSDNRALNPNFHRKKIERLFGGAKKIVSGVLPNDASLQRWVQDWEEWHLQPQGPEAQTNWSVWLGMTSEKATWQLLKAFRDEFEALREG